MTGCERVPCKNTNPFSFLQLVRQFDSVGVFFIALVLVRQDFS
jgi:hypothetical protein